MVTNSTTEVLPSGLMTEKIPNLKRRQRIRYYRQVINFKNKDDKVGKKEWMQTDFLPSDLEGRALYMAKGFRLTPPEGTEFARNNTEENKAKAETDAQKDILLQEQQELLKSLADEVATLKAQLLVKGKTEGSGKVGRPKRGG